MRLPRVILACCGLVGCGDGGSARQATARPTSISIVGGERFESLFAVVDTLILEEPRGVVTVAPRVAVDPLGGFLVADEQEHQVRVYARSGALQRLIGAGTSRRDSIRMPERAVRLVDGSILAANIRGPITIIPPDPDRPSRFVPSALRTIRNVVVLSDREVLLVGSDARPVSATLFPLDLATGRIGNGLFPPPPHLDRGVATTFSSVITARWGSRIGAVHMLSDTLVMLDLSGREEGRVPIPIDPFNVPRGSLPALKTDRDQQAWAAQFTMITDLFWIDRNRIVVQWVKPAPDGSEAERGILEMDSTGLRSWGIAPSPVLVAVRDSEWFFRDPRSSAPNRWLVARLRSRL